MATTLALAMRASMSASGVVSGANDASTAMDKMGRHAQQAARDMSVLKNIAIGAVVFKGASMAADAFMSAGRAVLSYASNVAQSVDQMNDLAQRTGIGVEALQSLQVAAKLGGVDDLTGHLQKMTVAIGNAADTGNIEAFQKLGLDFESLQAMAPEDQFRIIGAAIAKLPTEAERAAAAMKIFGKSGIELLPMFNQNLEETEARAKRLGIVLSENQVDAIGDMNDSLDMVKATFDGIIGQVVSNLAPAVQSVADEFLRFVENFEGGGTGMAEAISKQLIEVGKFLAGVFDRFVEGLGRFLQGLGAWVSTDLEAAGQSIREFGEAGFATNAMTAAETGFNDRNSPERESERRRRAEERKAAREAAAASDKAAREAQAQQKRQEEAAKVDEKIAGKQEEIDKIQAEKAASLNSKSNEALKSADIRSSEGMAQFIALATGREDPALEENRKTNRRLEEIRAELQALHQEKVDILGAAA